MNDDNLGFSDKSDPNEPTIAQQPIFLPAPQEQQPYGQPPQQSPSGRWIPPQGVGNRPLPTNPAALTKRSWRNDPVYRVLFIAIGVVLLSSLTCVAVLAAMFNQPSSQTAQSGGPNTQQTANAGGVNTSSPTPTATPTPEPTPTPTPTATPTPVIGKLTINVIDPVQNGDNVPVHITKSKPGANISLVIIYTNANSIFNANLSQDADDAGNATISWRVQVFPTNPRKSVTAELQVTAKDGQGYEATTKTVVTVKINNG
jgi:hypothetical protein